jgi:predicted RNA polymerase sigma factor
MSAEVVAAVARAHRPQAGLDALAPLLADPALATYGYLSAARADFLRRLHRWGEAALLTTPNTLVGRPVAARIP